MDGPQKANGQASHQVTMKVLEVEKKLLKVAQEQNAGYLLQLQQQLQHLEVRLWPS